MSITTIEKEHTGTTITTGVNAFTTESASLSSGTSRADTFGTSIRKAFKDGKLDGLVSKAKADYDAGRALDTLD
jgi:hypothetical protein